MRLRAWCLVVSLACAPALAQTDGDAQAQFAQAVKLLQEHQFAAALPLLDAVAATHPTTAVYRNIGLAATETGDNARALQAWLKLRTIAPDYWEARAKLVQAYQALGDIAARDRERAALVALWQSGANADLSKQPLYCREQFRQNGQRVTVLEYFAPAEPKMIVYSFSVAPEDGTPAYRVSLGSYDTTNKIAHELHEIPDDKRLFHLDLYKQSGHETHGFFAGQPTYEVVRAAVVDVLSGKSKSMSSSTSR